MSETKAGEMKPTETKPKKMVRRNVAIALTIACIVLIASLGITIEYHTIAIGDKERTITSLNDEIDLANFTVLANNQTINQTAGNYTRWTFIANVTGYALVVILSRTTNNTYIQVSYNATVPAVVYENGTPLYRDGGYTYCPYEKQVNFTSVGVFPILPSFVISPLARTPIGTSVKIRVGNTNTIENATERVTIVYYY